MMRFDVIAASCMLVLCTYANRIQYCALYGARRINERTLYYWLCKHKLVMRVDQTLYPLVEGEAHETGCVPTQYLVQYSSLG